MKDDSVYLRHILDCIQRIEANAAHGREEFLASQLLQDATLYNLQTMAESTKRLSADLKTSQPQIEWARIAGFRNVLVHDYLGVDMHLVWTILESELSPLKEAATAMLQSKEGPQ